MEKQADFKLKSLPSTTQSIDKGLARSKSPLNNKNNIYQEKACMTTDVKSLLKLSTRPNKHDYEPLSENRLKWLNFDKISFRNRTPSPFRRAKSRSDRCRENMCRSVDLSKLIESVDHKTNSKLNTSDIDLINREPMSSFKHIRATPIA